MGFYNCFSFLFLFSCKSRLLFRYFEEVKWCPSTLISFLGILNLIVVCNIWLLSSVVVVVLCYTSLINHVSAVSPPAHLCLSVWDDVVLYTELTQKVVCPNSRRQSLCTDLLFVFLRCFLCYFFVLFYFCFHFYCTRLKVNHLTMMFAVSHIFLFIIVIRMYATEGTLY